MARVAGDVVCWLKECKSEFQHRSTYAAVHKQATFLSHGQQLELSGFPI